NLVPDREGGLWVGGQRGVAGSVTYHYHHDGVPPAVAIVAGPHEVREDGRLRIEAIGIEKFHPRQPGKAFHFSWRIDGGPWSAFQPLPQAGLPVGGLRTAAHRLEIRCRDEGGDISPQPAESEFHVTPMPLQSRPWFRSAVL